MECDIGTLVRVWKLDVHDSTKTTEYLNKQKIISSLEALVQ